jgi:malate dehydrogenase
MNNELTHVKTITGYLPENGEGIKKAFTGADIIVIPAGIPRESDVQRG